MKKTLISIVVLCALIGQQVVTAQDWAAYDLPEEVTHSQTWRESLSGNVTDRWQRPSAQEWALTGVAAGAVAGAMGGAVWVVARKSLESMDLALYPFRSEHIQSSGENYFCQAFPWGQVLLYGVSDFFLLRNYLAELKITAPPGWGGLLGNAFLMSFFFGLRRAWQCGEFWLPQGSYLVTKVLGSTLNVSMNVFIHFVGPCAYAALGSVMMSDSMADIAKWNKIMESPVRYGVEEGVLRGLILWLDWEMRDSFRVEDSWIERILYITFLVRLAKGGMFQVGGRQTDRFHQNLMLRAAKIPVLLGCGIVSSAVGRLYGQMVSVRGGGMEAVVWFLGVGAMMWGQWWFAKQVMWAHRDRFSFQNPWKK